ncbi:MAG: TonB-dependent receptor [Nitrospinae bacterium]|nr:TonB-dependent receptor [Nitrospinota bacterium]
MRILACIYLALAFIASSATLVFSQDDSPLDAFMEAEKLEAELQWLKDETYVITASKTLEHIKKTAASVTVITDKEIRNMGARNLMDVLSTVPGLGVTIHNYGWYELESRGVKTTESDKILIMLNSHPLNVIYNGGALRNYHDLIIENIRKIEIIRGPGSAIYGANAFLAVVNILTKEAEDVDGAEFTSGGGSYGTQQYNLMLGKEIKDLDIFANFNFLDSGGFKGFVPRDTQTSNDEGMGTNASKAPGYTNSRLWKYDLDFGAGYRDFAFKGRYIRDKRGLFSGVANALDDKGYLKLENYFLELSYSRAIAANLDFSAKVYRDYSFRDSFYVVFPQGYASSQGAFPEGFLGAPTEKNTKHGAEIQLTWDWNDSNKAIFGAMGEYQRQFDVRQKLNFDPLTGAPLGSFQDVTPWANWNKNVSRNVWAVYGEDIFDVMDNLRLTAGARYDRYNDFGGTFNPRAGLVWEFINGYDLKLLHGRAFRAPSFIDMYDINNPVISGNPNLKPEKINTLEASVGAEFTESISSRITLFRNSIRDVIAQSDPDPVTGLRVYENSQNVISEGVELEMKAKLHEGSYLAMNYTFQNPREKITGRLADVPSNKGNIMANWEINEIFHLYGHLFLKGRTPRADGDTRSDVPGYGTVDATLMARNFLKGWEGLELRFSMYNLLDKKYADPAPAGTLPEDYPRPGRSVLGEVRYMFD